MSIGSRHESTADSCDKGQRSKFAGYIDENLMQFIESVPDAMILSDPKGRIVMVNANTERMFGYARNELMGKEVEILVPAQVRSIHPKKRGAYYADPSIRKRGGRARAIGM